MSVVSGIDVMIGVLYYRVVSGMGRIQVILPYKVIRYITSHDCIYILTADDKRSIHLYEDMNITAVRQPTESQHYTHMSPLDKKQLPPNYENMNKF